MLYSSMWKTRRHRLYPWELDPDEAISLQSQLSERLVLTWGDRPVTSIGGADVGFFGDHACAAIVVCRYPDMTPLSVITAVGSLAFPYTPGLLAFREGPIILSAWERLPVKDEHNPAHIIGAVVRTREKSKPLYISPGHLIDLENAVTFVRACCHGYRLPEPARWAHKISKGGDLPLECRTQ